MYIYFLPLQEASREPGFVPKDPCSPDRPRRELGPVMRKPKRLWGLFFALHLRQLFGVRDCDYLINYAIFLSAKADNI
jgi:hypothetical protein